MASHPFRLGEGRAGFKKFDGCCGNQTHAILPYTPTINIIAQTGRSRLPHFQFECQRNAAQWIQQQTAEGRSAAVRPLTKAAIAENPSERRRGEGFSACCVGVACKMRSFTTGLKVILLLYRSIMRRFLNSPARHQEKPAREANPRGPGQMPFGIIHPPAQAAPDDPCA